MISRQPTQTARVESLPNPGRYMGGLDCRAQANQGAIQTSCATGEDQFRPMGSDPDCLHYGVDPIYLYIVGRKDEPCVLELVVPPDWKVAVGLERIRNQGSHPTFKAKNYDTLVDNPVTAGGYFEARYDEHAKSHVVAIRGPAKDWIDRERTLQATRFVTRDRDRLFRRGSVRSVRMASPRPRGTYPGGRNRARQQHGNAPLDRRGPQCRGRDGARIFSPLERQTNPP